MKVTVIKGGKVVDSQGERLADVVVDSDAKVRYLGSDGENSVDEIFDPSLDEINLEILDAKDCYVTPGFVDLHVHFRQPGLEAAETIESGSRSAALGGFTAAVAMPNTNPCMDSAGVIIEVANYAKSALCEVKPSAAISIGRDGKELAPMGELFDLGVRMFTDDGSGVQDPALMRTALEYAHGLAEAAGTEVVLSQHCEIDALSKGGVMHEGEWSTKLGLGGQSREAEEFMVSRDIALSKLTRMRVHLQHLSSEGSVKMVRAAKEAGIPVTAEATPHHFTLTDEACKSYDPVFKVHPPLRTLKDVEAIKEGLADGTIDVIATDHAPHTPDSKELPFDQAPPGMVGLETAYALANTNLKLTTPEIVRLMSTRPSQIAGLTKTQGKSIEVGGIANLAILDPEKVWTVNSSELSSRSKNCPFDGMELKGKVRHTIYKGEVVVKDGEAQR